LAAVEVHHLLSGPPTAGPVVLSCSLGTSLAMWDPQAPALGERMRVVRYDLRGHGCSPVPPGPYEIADLGSDLLALLDRLELERVSLCGVSIGAMTSLWVAAHAPARVARVVACCTSADFGDGGAYRERAAAVRADGLEPIADAVVGRWFSPAYALASPEVVSRMRAMLVATPVEGYAGCCEALAAMDLRPELQLIEAPTLVIAGAEDPATPPEHGRLIADRVHGARLELIPGGAHLSSISHPELVTPLILEHLSTTEEVK
jgi:3-oxoadipate enol-lactonase